MKEAGEQIYCGRVKTPAPPPPRLLNDSPAVISYILQDNSQYAHRNMFGTEIPLLLALYGVVPILLLSSKASENIFLKKCK